MGDHDSLFVRRINGREYVDGLHGIQEPEIRALTKSCPVRCIWAIPLRVLSVGQGCEVNDYVSFDGRMQVVDIRKHDKKEKQKR
jgi:hypothetical protein